MNRGLGVTQPEILSSPNNHSCGIQSPDGDPPLENRTLLFRINAQDAYKYFQSVTIAIIVF